MTRLCVAIVLAVAALASAAGSSATAATLPSGALVRVAASQDTAVGYGQADVCPTCSYDAQHWARRDGYVLGDGGDGTLLVGTLAEDRLRLSGYDTRSYRRTSTRSVRFDGWRVGGALIAADGFVYVLLGRSNPREERDRVVIEIRKYDRSLALRGVAGVQGGFDRPGIFTPFEATSSSLALAGNTLLVHTARLIFHIPGDSAANHQVNLSFAVDTATMTTSPVTGAPYSSHSFRQFVRARGTDAVFLDHGDAYPRALQVGFVSSAFAPITGCGDNDYTDAPCGPPSAALRVLGLIGKTGDNATGTAATGFEVGSTRALTTGVSVPHANAVRGVTGSSARFVRNAFLITTSLASRRSSFQWLTTYKPRAKGISVSQPQLVPLSPNRFALLFTTIVNRRRALRYFLLDEAGTVLVARTWTGRRFTALAQPLAIGGTVFWVGVHLNWNRSQSRRGRLGGGHYLYGLDLRDPGRPRFLKR